MDDLTKRNFLALSEGLKEQRAKTSKLEIQITQYNELIGAMQAQVQVLQSQVGFLTASVAGHGATS